MYTNLHVDHNDDLMTIYFALYVYTLHKHFACINNCDYLNALLCIRQPHMMWFTKFKMQKKIQD